MSKSLLVDISRAYKLEIMILSLASLAKSLHLVDSKNNHHPKLWFEFVRRYIDSGALTDVVGILVGAGHDPMGLWLAEEAPISYLARNLCQLLGCTSQRPRLSATKQVWTISNSATS